MTIALKSDAGDFIYFDAVTNYSQNYSSSVSQHPVDGSGVISDNVVKNNPVIKIRGVLSGADFNSSKPELISEDRNRLGVLSIVSDGEIAQPITVNYDTNPNTISPDVIGQFFTDSLPEISGLTEGREASYSERALSKVLKTFYEDRVQLTLYEFDDGTIVDEVTDLYLVGLPLEESAQTGDSIHFSLTLEKVQISTLIEEEIPEDIRSDFQEQAAERVNRGEQSTETFEDGDADLQAYLSSLFLGDN